MDFEIEYNPEAELCWWAVTTVQLDDNHTVAIGAGDNVWEAIGACLEEIPHTKQYLVNSAKYMAAARAGNARCPGCGAPRPPLTPETAFWAFYCAKCRGDNGND